MVTTLSLSSRLFLIVSGLVEQVTNTARPVLGTIIGKGDLQLLRRTQRTIFLMSAGLSIAGAASVLCVNQGFVVLWVGAENYGGISLDIVLAINLVVNNCVLPHRALLSAALQVKNQVVSRVVEGAFNLTLAIILARHFGIVGIVMSTAVASALTSLWYLPYLSTSIVKQDWRAVLREEWKPVGLLVLSIIPAIALAMLINELVEGITGVLIGGFTIVILSLVLVWSVGLDHATRSTLVSKVQNSLPARIRSSA